MKKRTALALAVLASTAALTAVASPAAQAQVPANDCAVLGPIASGAIGVLSPIQTESPAQQRSSINNYVAQLRAQQSKLTSPQAKADLGSYIGVIQSVTGPGDANRVLNALTKLQGDCP